VAKRFGAYEILYELKTGGMGAVLLGRRRGPGAFEQLVAIKTIRPEYAQTPAVRAMFLDEAAILARLSHPAIAAVHDFGEDGGTLYMVMEYVAGIAFRDIMDHGLPPAVAARAIAEACRGVHAAHELHDLSGNVLGVVHRDISPDNLMFGFDGHIKVIDFGIALVKNRQAPVTEFGTVKGKPPYMSPEQVKNEAMDRRSDVFSLAVVLWEMLTRRGLFDGDSIYAIARAVEHQEIKPPSQLRGEPLPLGLDAAVMNALDRDRARRTQTAAAFAEQLEQVIQTAGDETLEAWAERALEDPRAAHRAWLASVVAGRDAPRPIGRPTGSVTALAPQLGKAPTMIAPIAPAALPTTEPPPDPQASTHLAALGDDDRLDRPPRRSLVLPIVLGLLVLAVVGGGVVFVRRAGEPGAPRDAGVVALPIDASADAAFAIDAGAADAAVPEDAPPVDPPVDPPIDPPIDAGHRRPVRVPLDAGRTVGRDAQVPTTAAAVIDAAPQGYGALTAKSKGEQYLSVIVDGRMVGPTPMFDEPILAGTHVIELVEPKTSEVVVRRTVKVEVGKTVTIVEP
jgi:eukaryotic-like serine/threonine-protein kinase